MLSSMKGATFCGTRREDDGMAWQIPLSTNVAIDLGEADSLLVLPNVAVAITGFNTAVYGSGGSQSVEVYGSIGAWMSGVFLGDAPNQLAQNSVYVGSTGHIQSFLDTGVAFWGQQSSLTNDGTITSKVYGALFNGIGAGKSTLDNAGLISGDTIGIWHTGSETLATTNSGRILSKDRAYVDAAGGQDILTNTGRIVGNIVFGDGNDTYNGQTGALKGKVYGDGGNDTLRGGADKDVFYGGAGDDKLYGGTGKDVLAGNAGVDKLYGGADADTFVYSRLSDSTRPAMDMIMDFARGDVINLSAIDANAAVAGNQKFAFIGSAAFHGIAGELRFQTAGGDSFVYGDVNGDRIADIAIRIDTPTAFVAADFIL